MDKKTLRNERRQKKTKLSLLYIGGILAIFLIVFASSGWWIGTAPTHYYKFNESGAGDNAVDELGLTTLSVTGTCTVEKGKLGNGRVCDGAGSYMNGTTGGNWNFGSGAFTVAVWFNISNITNAWGTCIHNWGTTWCQSKRWGLGISNTGDGSIQFCDNEYAPLNINPSIHDAKWHRVVVSRTNTGTDGIKMYLDGVNIANGTDNANLNELGTLYVAEGGVEGAFGASCKGNGPIDDLQIFKGYAWTDSDVNADYNSGAGKEADISDLILSLTTTLLTPSDLNITIGNSIIFEASVTPINSNITNTTLFVWYTNHTIFGTNLTVLSGNTINTSISSISGLTAGNYNWNVFGCVKNNTGSSMCKFDSTNRSFTKTVFSIASQTFTKSVYETSRQIFEMNISTINSVLSVNSKLIYNGTNYSASSNCITGSCIIKSSIDIPLIPIGSQQNKSFYWELKIYDGTTSNTFDTLSSKQEQNVTAINLTICSATYATNALNFTAFDEQNLTRIPIFDYAGTFDFWLGGGSVKKSYTHANTTAREVDFCIQPNQTFYIDGNVRYNFKDANLTLNTKSYYFQNFSLNNILNHIDLYLLNIGSSTSFILQVLKNNAGVASALINVQRYYPEFGFWKTVQIARTDANGESIGYYEIETVDYRHIIYGSDGSLLLTTTSQKVVGKSAPFTLIFDVGEAPGTPWSGFLNQTNYTTSLLWNVTNKMVTFSYIDLSGNALRGRLIVELEKYSNKSVVICNITSTISAATLTCNLSSYTSGTFIAKGYVETAAETKLLNLINFVISTATSILDYSAVIMGWFIILTVALAFFWNPSVDIIAVNIAVIFVNIIGLVTFSPVWIFGMIAMSIILLILMRT